MNTFPDKDNKRHYVGGGRLCFIWIGLGLLTLMICSCNRYDPQPTPFIPTDLPVKILPTSFSFPIEIPTIPPTFTPVPSATPAPTLKPSPTATPVFSNPFSSLKSGQYFLYYTGDPLEIISVDGQEKIEVLLPPAWSKYAISELSPDRKKLALYRGLELYDLEQGTLLIADLEGNKDQLLMEGVPCYGAAWSPDGTQLIAGCGDSLDVFSLATGEQIGLPATCGGACFSMKWSPDGKWIAYQTNNEMRNGGLFLMDTACFAQHGSCPASSYKQMNLSPDTLPYAWSPDGKYLVFATTKISEGKDNIVLELFDIQTRRVQRSIDIPGAKWRGSLAWSPDGKWILFEQDADGIYKVPIEGGAPILTAHLPAIRFIRLWITIP
jgi:hypothetical protein